MHGVVVADIHRADGAAKNVAARAIACLAEALPAASLVYGNESR